MPGYNFNHFTGKTKSFKTPKRKKTKPKVKSVHKNKYEVFSNNKKPPYTVPKNID